MGLSFVPGLLLAAALLTAPLLVKADDAVQLTLPARTEVTLKLQEPVSSATATQGRHFNLLVDADVVSQGQVLIPRGTPAVGTILAAESAGQMGAGGMLSVKADYLLLGTQRVRLHWTLDSTDRSQERKARALSAFFVPLGFTADGKDIEITTDTGIKAYTKDDVEIVVPAAVVDAAPGGPLETSSP